VIGSAVYMGRWLPAARDLIEGHREVLSAMPVWLFSSGPLGDPSVPVEELAGVQNRKHIQYLPDAPAHCLGLAGVRGRVAAIYDLGAVLGSPSPDRLSWFFQTKADPQVALLVPKPDRYLRVPLDGIVPHAGVDGASVGAVTDAGVVINVLSVGRIVDGIHGRRGALAP